VAIFNFYPAKKNIVDNSVATSYQHPPIALSRTKNPPPLLSQSYVLVDSQTNTILLSKNLHGKIYPASTTKLATAITALNVYPLDEVISIGQTYSEGKVMSLLPSEEITIRSLVTALLVYSANDSAYNLAIHHQKGISGFVDEMNQIAKRYNLKNTHFTNFDGIHSPNHFSTVYDLSQLGRLAILNPVITETVKNKKITVTSLDGKTIHDLDSTNELLEVIPEIKGLKTGWTPEASGIFISLININGHELIAVVAQSEDRFGDTRQLVDWSKANVYWQPYR
jgi:D-alanyl-D-alanine carboxypeptidase (penicillin-binding protein 5/6)